MVTSSYTLGQLLSPLRRAFPWFALINWIRLLGACSLSVRSFSILKYMYQAFTIDLLLCRTSIPQGNAVVNENNGQESEDGSIEVTPLMVVIFVVLICGTLLLLYFFYNYLVYVVIVLFCLASCHGLYECLTPIILWLPLGKYTYKIIN